MARFRHWQTPAQAGVKAPTEGDPPRGKDDDAEEDEEAETETDLGERPERLARAARHRGRCDVLSRGSEAQDADVVELGQGQGRIC